MHIGCSGLECSFQRSGYPVNARRARSKATSAVARRVAGISMEWENESERFRVLDFIAPLRALRHCSGVERSRPTEAKRFPRYRDEEETDGFQKEKNEWMEMKGGKREGKGREGKGRKKRGEDGRNGSWDGSISASVVGRGFGMRKVHFPR